MYPIENLILRRGALSFSAEAQGAGPLVVCLHGFPDHARSFRMQRPALTAAGYRVVVPTMRGYEPSSQPADDDYQLLRLAEDVVAWLDALGAPRCHLIGHDWGAVVAYLVAARTPERLDSLTTMAVPHPGRMLRQLWYKRPSQLVLSWYMLFFQLPGVAEYAIERDDWALVGYVLPADELRALKNSLSQPGVKVAALSYYRALFRQRSQTARETRRLLARPITVRTLSLTGADDGCMDTRLFDDLMVSTDFPDGLCVKRLDGAGHFLHQEQPERVNRLLLDWLPQR
jgi:pimeloyl-ACP methyl ester carboxylesterase